MKAALIITGSEMLSGYRRDALVQPFAARLKAKGLPVGEVRLLGDAPQALASAIRALDAELIVVTGGLGLTPDDTTASAVDLLKEKAVIGSLPNPVGSASGIDLHLPGKRVVFLPGVPAEAQAMFANLLESMAEAGPATGEITIFGLREIDIAARLGDMAGQIGYLPRDMEVTLIVPAPLMGEVRAALGQHCLLAPDMATELGGLLKQRGLRLACAESCTGGLIGHLITEVPGSSAYFLGSIVAYHNDIKSALLGVDPEILAVHGAVSQQTALAMHAGIARLTGAEVAIATTGIAGPGGGAPEKPAGTIWVAAGSPEQPVAQCFHYAFGRSGNKLIGAKAAMGMLRRIIHDQNLYRTAAA